MALALRLDAISQGPKKSRFLGSLVIAVIGSPGSLCLAWDGTVSTYQINYQLEYC
jgi:hypothetical protein